MMERVTVTVGEPVDPRPGTRNSVSLRQAVGRPIDVPDAMIAATAIAAEADAVATQDGAFIDVGVPVVDPWSG